MLRTLGEGEERECGGYSSYYDVKKLSMAMGDSAVRVAQNKTRFANREMSSPSKDNSMVRPTRPGAEPFVRHTRFLKTLVDDRSRDPPAPIRSRS